jgi:hypothetical protein
MPPPPRPPVLDLDAEEDEREALLPRALSSLDVDHQTRQVRRQAADPQPEWADEDAARLAAGDLDASAHAAGLVGEETPGGDNPTPDQDVVDLIGRSLGVEYDDDEELEGGEEIRARDRHRWELDPASSEDWKERRR